VNAQRSASLPYRWEVVMLLWCAYFLFQADKQVYSVVLTPLRDDLGLSGYEAGLVSTLFTVVVAIVSPFAGALGDRFPRHRTLIWSVGIWSAGTALVGAANGIALLVLTRSLVTATAESFYPPVSHAYLAEQHSKTRALAISIHQTAQYAGPIGAGYLAGWIAEQFGWRQSFMVFGVAGVALSAWMAIRMRPTAESRLTTGEPLLQGILHSIRQPGVQRIGLGFAAVLFVTIGYNTWAPTIFGEMFGLSLSQAGFQTAFFSSACAMGGALAGGWLSDRLANAGRSRFDLQAAALLLAAPFLWLLGAAQTLPLALTALGVVGFFRGIYEGTIAVTLYDFVAPRYRASAAAVVLLIANLLASPSSAALGWVADRADLNQAVSALSVFFVVGAAVLFSARTLPRNAG
jgi:MFS family permease